MYSVPGLSINQLYYNGLDLLQAVGKTEDSRNGVVLVVPEPVFTEWADPTLRVLVNKVRNCNHAFHINEAIWMLRGENDATKLDKFVHDFSSRFAEPTGILHGAYGHRWMHEFGIDQIDKVIHKVLIKDPLSRQAVIQMWSCTKDLGAQVKDKPCNTNLFFRIQNNRLEMTVCNRSNDIIWGLYGANAVHFSILLEYMAHMLEVKVGTMWTLSNNFHAYTDVLNKMLPSLSVFERWSDGQPVPLIAVGEDKYQFMRDVMNWDYGATANGFKTYWFNKVAIPVTRAYLHKTYKEFSEMETWLERIEDENWYAGMRQLCHH